MRIHKNTKLLPYMRKEIYSLWQSGTKTVSQLARDYKVSRNTIYKIIERARLNEFQNRSSMNHRFRTITWGLRRIVKIERKLQKRIDRQNINRYEKDFPGEQEHFDTKRLPLLDGEAICDKREHLHIAIDDYSRYVIADILPDKGQYSGAIHLQEVLDTAPFIVEEVFSDNGSTYKGRKDHAFVQKCLEKGITQRFTRVRRPQTNGKAERVIRTFMEEWHKKGAFKNRKHRRQSLHDFVIYYNTQRLHSALKGRSPLQVISDFYANQSVNNP